jgi:hypothetical protein
MVNSVSFGHAVANPGVGDGESLPTSSDPRVPDHLRDRLDHETREIANRLTFESRFDARELIIPSERVDVGGYRTTQTRSSTP